MRLNVPHHHPLLLGFSLAVSSLTGVASAAKPKNAILLSDVQSLTLSSSKQTSHRRVPAIPQLKCISPRKMCALHEVAAMRCVNQGSSYGGDQDIQWACTAADLPTTLRLGSTEVICEGYSSPDDDYVLRGSCGVEYRLVLTEEGERRFPELSGGAKWGGGWWGDSDGGGGGGEDVDWSGYLFAIVFFAVLGWIIYGACVQAEGNRRRTPGQQQGRRPGGGGGGGGGGGWGPGWGPGGGGGWDDPPPPYSSKPTSTGDAAAGGWRPGFWTGLAGGAAASYLAGNRGSGSRQQQYYDNDNNNGGYGSFWGGPSNRRSGGGSSSSGSGSSSSVGRHESTGFGSTSRR